MCVRGEMGQSYGPGVGLIQDLLMPGAECQMLPPFRDDLPASAVPTDPYSSVTFASTFPPCSPFSFSSSESGRRGAKRRHAGGQRWAPSFNLLPEATASVSFLHGLALPCVLKQRDLQRPVRPRAESGQAGVETQCGKHNVLLSDLHGLGRLVHCWSA